MALTKEQIERRKQEAVELVKQKARQSGLAAIVPVPLFDMGTDYKLMTEIEDDINEIFGVTSEELKDNNDSMKTRLAIMVTSGAGEFIAKQTTKVVLKQLQNRNKRTKVGPISVGTVVTHGTSAVVSYTLMRKLGMDHIEKVVKYLDNQTVI
ncbi:hypothetical protein [Phocicoccus pinnipedialis]|uniref:DUF697 domain-containing protein n=1 Tax=Phocicoccus pinnipedialis TaxID=110845 RepID=A0A6V7RJ35_9BACL|nr:hypothetical protein [Jeotgalicoccus pinnipedialis]MBP1938982.1 hypothetical protein [Jeotgalicoccus pinnipedialis]CAD2077303.1 hypothetical protein JEOPIN946_01456 [Jeotgalicoccus pinnipedialis]